MKVLTKNNHYTEIFSTKEEAAKKANHIFTPRKIFEAYGDIATGWANMSVLHNYQEVA